MWRTLNSLEYQWTSWINSDLQINTPNGWYQQPHWNIEIIQVSFVAVKEIVTGINTTKILVDLIYLLCVSLHSISSYFSNTKHIFNGFWLRNNISENISMWILYRNQSNFPSANEREIKIDFGGKTQIDTFCICVRSIKLIICHKLYIYWNQPVNENQREK